MKIARSTASALTASMSLTQSEMVKFFPLVTRLASLITGMDQSKASSSSNEYYLILEHRNYKLVEELKGRIAILDAKIQSLQAYNREVELKYAFECHLNMELCDLCRSHGVDFRPSLESARSAV